MIIKIGACILICNQFQNSMFTHLNLSCIVGFDHENEITSKEQKIKKEIKQELKTEPVGYH